jgi:hypothetical protein
MSPLICKKLISDVMVDKLLMKQTKIVTKLRRMLAKGVPITSSSESGGKKTSLSLDGGLSDIAKKDQSPFYIKDLIDQGSGGNFHTAFDSELISK